MSNTEALLEKQNQLLTELLHEIKGLKVQNSVGNVNTCTPEDALVILGYNNPRYLTYFFRKGLLDRRRGGKGFLYFKSECKQLADAIRDRKVVVPNIKTMYGE